MCNESQVHLSKQNVKQRQIEKTDTSKNKNIKEYLLKSHYRG